MSLFHIINKSKLDIFKGERRGGGGGGDKHKNVTSNLHQLKVEVKSVM